MASNTRRRNRTRGAAEAANPESTSSESLPRIHNHEPRLEIRRTPFESPWRAFIFDSEEDPTTRVRVFPRFGIFSLMALTLYSRHLFHTGFEGLGMLHPDENFQAIEVAHAEVYGYGFILHEEYRSGAVFEMTNATTSRPSPSWIYPQMYILLFRAKEFFGWSMAPFVLARRFHGMIAAMLPFSVYKFTRTTFGHSRDIAFIAATLVAFSKHLMLLGIHPFLQSFISPLLFMTLTIILKIIGVGQDYHPDRSDQFTTSKPPDLNLGAKLGLLVCGFILGVLLFVNADSLLIVLALLIVCLIPSHSSTMDTLPSKRALVGSIILFCGFSAGMALGAVQDYTTHGLWCFTPLRAIQFMIGSFGDEPTHTKYISSFLSGSHVHGAVILAAIIVSIIYVVNHWKILRIFDGTIDANDKVLFQSTFRISIIAFVFLVFYSCQNYQDIRIIHDVIVLILIAGSAAVYLLYSGLYTYVMSVAAPGRTTRNMIKLILYAELFLYMFEARMTFPTAQNRNITEWAHEGQWESAFVNQCLRYVGQQTDVTGLVIDYRIQMTGSFSLLHHNVPIYARSGLEFREWGIPVKSRFNANKNDLEDDAEQNATQFTDVRVSTLDDATDFISLLNPGLLMKRVIEKVHYNYVIITESRKFFKRGFREVFNASDARVFKRSKSWTESEYLKTVADNIPIGTNATILEYEGKWLIALKRYTEAVERLKTAVEINSGDVSRLQTWKMLIFALRELNQFTEADEAIKTCKVKHVSECEERFEMNMGELMHHALDSDLRTASENYKFPT